MATPVRASEGASLALHAAVVLAREAANGAGPVPTAAIASRLRSSEAHLAKVLQRLVKAGLVRSERGPRGGFVLARASRDVRLLEVYEAIEGSLRTAGCLFRRPVCEGGPCIMGDLLTSVNAQVESYLSTTTLADLAEGAPDRQTARTYRPRGDRDEDRRSGRDQV